MKKILNYIFYVALVVFAIFYFYKVMPKKGPAYFFETKNIRNEKVNLENYKGRVIVLDFWGTWCPPCRRMIPKLVKLNSEYKSKGVSILGLHVVSGFNGNAYTRQFAKKYKINYPTWISTREIEKKYGVKSYPTIIVIDKKGEVRNIVIGTQSERKMRKILDKLIAE